MNLNTVAIFASGFAVGAGTAIGIIALTNWLEDKKEKEEKEGYESEFARVMGAEGYDDNEAFVAVNADPWNVDESKAHTYPSEIKIDDLIRSATSDTVETDLVHYSSYYDSSLANDISESLTNPLINPSSLLEDERMPETGEDDEPSHEESLTGQFLKDPSGFNIPKNAVWLSYFGMDDTLCYDDNMQKAMSLEKLFNVPICAAIRNAADLGDDGQDRFVVIDAKKAKIFVVDVLPHDSWSDAIPVQ